MKSKVGRITALEMKKEGINATLDRKKKYKRKKNKIYLLWKRPWVLKGVSHDNILQVISPQIYSALSVSKHLNKEASGQFSVNHQGSFPCSIRRSQPV